VGKVRAGGIEDVANKENGGESEQEGSRGGKGGKGTSRWGTRSKIETTTAGKALTTKKQAVPPGKGNLPHAIRPFHLTQRVSGQTTGECGHENGYSQFTNIKKMKNKLKSLERTGAVRNPLNLWTILG